MTELTLANSKKVANVRKKILSLAHKSKFEKGTREVQRALQMFDSSKQMISQYSDFKFSGSFSIFRICFTKLNCHWLE